ncbi:hypothetical protein NQ318_017514 [Aromia moschata]|uniref:Uncharacterized protein n=1 Tax=Aromia moschata TaxID=1265417 RepID=A0AAV8Z2Y6_9CUCU|nr:hypothetical protein NQ318_017514 [Aromia moschata]
MNHTKVKDSVRLLNYHAVDPPKSPKGGDPQRSPGYPRSPKTDKIGIVSPKVSLSSPSQTERAVFDFNQSGPRSPNSSCKSPRSPRKFNYEEDVGEMASSDCDSFNFNLASPPKRANRAYNRQVYQSSKSDSVNSTKSSLEYSSTTKHPTGAYQDIEYKICHSLDSDSQTTSSYRYSITSTSSRHSSFKMKNKPKCNIRTNPGYDERYSSSKSINESERMDNSLQSFIELQSPVGVVFVEFLHKLKFVEMIAFFSQDTFEFQSLHQKHPPTCWDEQESELDGSQYHAGDLKFLLGFLVETSRARIPGKSDSPTRDEKKVSRNREIAS